MKVAFAEHSESAHSDCKVKSADSFAAEYVPITYCLEGILPGGVFYALTGKRGSAKTSLLIGVSLSKAYGRNLCGFDADQGRVAYATFENPSDFRMKLIAAAYVHNINLDGNIAIVDERMPAAELFRQFEFDTLANGPLALVVIDTFQASYCGKDFNNNAEILTNAATLRQLTSLPGNPTVMVACHPIKNASRDNLEPYGGGAMMNELDGNLTLWNEAGRIELGWNKVRGPEFETQYFRIDKLGSPDILDSKGRAPLLPVIRPASAESIEQQKHREGDTGVALLRALYDDPTGWQSSWAAAIGISQQAVSKKLQILQAKKLVEEGVNNHWRLTPKGKREIEESLNSQSETPKPSGKYYANS